MKLLLSAVVLMTIGKSLFATGWDPVSKTYDPTGYIRLKENVKESGTVASFEAGTNWEDGYPPENGKSYYVPATSSLRMLNTCKTPFKGSILATAGGSTYQGSTASIPVYHLLSGAYTDIYNNTQTFTDGVWTLFRTEDKPVKLRTPQTSKKAENRGYIFKNIVLKGDSDTALEVSTSENTTDHQWSEFNLESGNNLSDFFGTISITSSKPATQQTTFRPPQKEDLTFSGTLKLGQNCYLNASNLTEGTSADCSIGNLIMESSSDLRLALSETTVRSLTVTGSFAHVDGKVPLTVYAKPLGDINAVNGSTSGSITALTTIEPIAGTPFRMKVLNETDSVPRFKLDDFAVDYLGKGTLGLPTVLTSIVREDGFDKLKVETKGIVRKNTNNEASYGTSLTNGLAWSDRTDPRPGWDYFANTQIRVPSGDWHFAGDSLSLGAKSSVQGELNFVNAAGRTVLQVSRLGLEGGAKVWGASKDAWLFAPQVVTYPSAFGNVVIQEYGGSRLTIVGELCGSGDIFLRYHANKSAGKLAKGYLTFCGANTNFVGRVKIGCEGYENPTDNSYSANEDERIEVTVGDGRALGGELPSFVFDGIRIRDWALLDVTNTTEFVAANRGIFVDWIGCVGVKDGCVATFRAPFTFGGRLQKEGAGTISFGGTDAKFAVGTTDNYTLVDEPIAGTNELYVKEGFVEVAAVDALNGVAITFAKGAGIKVDYASTDDVRTYGLRNTKWATPVAFDADVDTISVVMENLPEEVTGEQTFGVMTVPADQADVIKGKLVFNRNGRKNFGGKFGKVENGDVATITLTVAPRGLVLVVR